ncbi:unnamed protein product [Phaedon cochleariae]|uniref:Uncharacterized protein n=1 Tax=Phaedon cochleariae TaxID=80249 RepID=A0A9N9SIR0_PHACE|nr:unnamed protein product [Phaedon cochleariae]
MNNFPKVCASDDEDDLELLRLKALETLKRKNAAADSSTNIHLKGNSPDKHNQYGRNKRRRTFGPHPGRGGKNFQGHFNRPRNTNLIAITPVSDETDIKEKPFANRATNPTHSNRYAEKQDNVTEGTSKFNRYDNSDKSDTESEEEEEESESEEASPGKLERADSLEALMQELDDEIQGKPKAKEEKQANGEKPKKKTKKKKRLTSDSDHKNTDSKTDNEQSDKSTELVKQDADKPTENEEATVPNEHDNNVEAAAENAPTRTDNIHKKRQRSRSPFTRRTNFRPRRAPNYPNSRHLPHLDINPFQPPHMYPPFNQMYPPLVNQPPPFYERPISPLSINTESLTTATLAPLSPRSAAFVLQNKAIIEKRKRSPRRSYSRSFSRSLSRSPRRSLTPPRRPIRRSISPRRLSRSPRRFSPRRRSLSPRRRNVARKDSSPKSKNSGRNRPGKSEDNKVKDDSKGKDDGKVKDAVRDKEKEKLPVKQPKEEASLDPVLEARKRKFESNQLGKKAGIIRLKPKEEKQPESAPMQELPSAVKEETQTPTPASTEVDEAKPIDDTNKDPDEFKELEKLLNEDLLLESDDFIDHKVEDIFSDEESTSDNEGRFKVKQKAGEKVSVLSFSKLMNGAKAEVKTEPLQSRGERSRDRHSSSRYNERKRRTPTDRRLASRRNEGRERKEAGRDRKDEEKEAQKKVETQEKSSAKQRISLRKERPPPSMDKRFERKIEIKIKNPSKYEKSGKERISKGEDKGLKAEKVIESEKEEEAVVELKDEDEVDEVGPDNVEEVMDEDNLAVNEGDLRAQLSRKRAEKLHKIPAEEVSSRILQFALQGAVYRKTKKKSKDKNITDNDGKLPIHLRLGLTNQTEIFEDVKVKRKSRKRKNREVLEQVYNFLLQDFLY